jgi:protein phosphatase-4 regulatory subunit 3
LTELFAQLTDDKTEEIRRKELVLFLKEFCTFAQALQPPGRESFFKTLNNLGILQVTRRFFFLDRPRSRGVVRPFRLAPEVGL